MSWNLFEDLQQMLRFHFMLNALRAGIIVAVVAGAIGYVMVLRRESFAGHTLSVIGFPGAAGATWLGLGAMWGFFGFCIAGALVIAGLPGTRRAGGSGDVGGAGEQPAGVGTVQAFALACGFLFVSRYHGFLSGLNDLLFGTITGITDAQVLVLLAAGTLTLTALLLLGRPLMFATLDPEIAAASGVPVRLINSGYLVLLGIAAAGTSQVTGSLLVFALLVAPAAAATRFTARPAAGLSLSIGIALLITLAGETAAFFTPFPIGFWVTTFGFAAFLLASAYRAATDRFGQRWPSAPALSPAGGRR
ncbi:MAG: metal ABC transporter permease [Pseudonocardia sp.]|nr:metal ABC transporter permease [Pseudonocardia sp.]